MQIKRLPVRSESVSLEVYIHEFVDFLFLNLAIARMELKRLSH